MRFRKFIIFNKFITAGALEKQLFSFHFPLQASLKSNRIEEQQKQNAQGQLLYIKSRRIPTSGRETIAK